MYKTRLGEVVDGSKLQLGYVEMDPSGRYGRFREMLGKGAMKTVYKAFDEVLAMEVAWNQVKLHDVFRSPEELQRLYSEVHLLKNLNHESIIQFYAYWIDAKQRTFNFITEMFTSGTLREYRKKYKRVDIQAVKNWSRQILRGLAYLHCHDPPVIHRDLKCDNIFVNGHLGQVKIGDLGLAAILRGSHHAHSVIGTPEFMAPELYEEDYDELVDVYSFGMCVLEMLTSEYPYSECSNPAQIYKKVTSGKLPEAFYRIQDLEARSFIAKCLETASKRPSAQELLADPFLADDEEAVVPVISGYPSYSMDSSGMVVDMPVLRPSSTRSTEMTITGTMDPVDDTIFLRVKLTDKYGQARNVYFPFDTVSDTAVDVAMEMVRELEIEDWDPLEIAQMIEEEISALVPSWKKAASGENHNQHSFNFDDDDESPRHPCCSHSSHSSVQSLTAFYNTSKEAHFQGSCNIMTSSSSHHWNIQEDLLIDDDDASSQSSLNSYNYSNLSYCSGNENHVFDLIPITGESNSSITGRAQNCTRFCPEESMRSRDYYNDPLINNQKSHASSHHPRKMTRIKSQMDLRSQLLHRSLVEEINKRRLFKTVGAVENIGYKEPGEFSGGMYGHGFNSRKSSGNSEGAGFEW